VIKVAEVNYPGKTQLQMLGPIPNPLILKDGAKGVLSPFRKPDIVGKVISMQVFVYVFPGWMEVNELKINKEEKKELPAARNFWN
jgi:hypothetical protein